MAVFDIRTVVSGWTCIYVRQPVDTRTAPQTAGRRVPLCVHDYRAFRTMQEALEAATAVPGSQ